MLGSIFEFLPPIKYFHALKNKANKLKTLIIVITNDNCTKIIIAMRLANASHIYTFI